MLTKYLRNCVVASWICLSLSFSTISMDSLTEQFHGMGLNPQAHCNRWTHFPQHGDTIFITDGTQITVPTKHHAKRKYDIVDRPLKDFFCGLNHGLYFGGYGGRVNHLFISFRVAIIPPHQKNMIWKKYVLCWNETQKKFVYHDFENLPTNACFADFYNQASLGWENNTPKNVNGKKVKFVYFSSQGIPGVVAGNNTHSEPGALGFLEARKDLVLNTIQELDPSSKFKMF